MYNPHRRREKSYNPMGLYIRHYSIRTPLLAMKSFFPDKHFTPNLTTKEKWCQRKVSVFSRDESELASSPIVQFVQGIEGISAVAREGEGGETLS